MMTSDSMSKLRRSLVLHEGYTNHVYVDTEGKLTVGIGYNLSDRGLDDDWINTQYLSDVTYFHSQLSTFSWFNLLCEDRKIVLIDMCFMGYKKFLQFHEMIGALSTGHYDAAAEAMLNSEWAIQVKKRATDLALAMRTGVYNV